ncbi:hypothetical protein [Gilvimarinus japonicus]|uniref:Uncharacterized protein n=1 Tax=Gilvimarinus japonicus TaxID=1796469 RepID=A0ABV7HJN4_9GAMM
MKKIVFSGVALSALVFVVAQALVMNGPDSTNEKPSAIADNSVVPYKDPKLSQVSTKEIATPSETLADESSETEVSVTQKIYNWMKSIVGFENAVMLTAEESDEYLQWQRDKGLLVDDLNSSGYSSYEKSALYALAQQGDLKAYEALLYKVDSNTPEAENLDRIGLILGAFSAPYSLATEVSGVAEKAYDDGDHEAYRSYFVEKLALLEFAKMRGMVLPEKGMERVLDGYKLDDNIEDIQIQAQQRNFEILQEVNAYREKQGWEPLNHELPSAVRRQLATNACGDDANCIRENALPKD